MHPPSRLGAGHVAALAAAVSLLAACGGGRAVTAAAERQPATQAAQETRTAGAAPGPVARVRMPELVVSETPVAIGPDAAGQGHYALPGIGRIPHGDLKLSTREIRDAVLIADLEPDPARRIPHIDLMMITACGAYVIACEDPFDPDKALFHGYYPSSDSAVQGGGQKIREAERLGSKIVSHSVGPFLALLDAQYTFDPDTGDRVPHPFALVQPTGNERAPSVFSLAGPEPWPYIPTFRYDPFQDKLVFARRTTRAIGPDTRLTFHAGDTLDQHARDSFWVRQHNIAFEHIRWSVANDRVIYTAGYTIDSQGREVRHRDSNDCVGVEEVCVWVPYRMEVWEAWVDTGLTYQGTSFGPPRVAMAMASMLSVYPDLSPANLVFLTRACARPVETLSGNGIADFSCMLDIGESGVVSVKDTEDLGLPDIIPPFSLPGSLMVATRLVDRQGRESPFHRRIPAAPLAHRSGLALAGLDTPGTIRDGLPPQFRLAIREDVDLFGIQGSGRRPGLGVAWRRGPLFAAVGHAVRDRFFGFAGGGGAWNFRGTREIGANLGHDNLYLRLTNQRTRSRAELQGNSVGITARKELRLRGDWTLGLLAEADRFIGGKARIPGMDGAARIAAGKPGYRGEVRLTIPF